MSTNLPERLAPELDRYVRLGRMLALSESGDRSPDARAAAGALRFYYAEALRLPPMAAAELSVIDGKLVASALLLRALAEERGYRVVRLQGDSERCVAVLYRGPDELGRSTFTIEQAKQAGLATRTNWRTYPDRMLWARASSNVIRDYAPAVAVGIITAEEIEVEAIEGDEPEPVEADAIDWPDPDEADPAEDPVPLDAAAEYDAKTELDDEGGGSP